MIRVDSVLKDLFSKKDTVVGIDIGTSAVKVAVFKLTTGLPELVHADLKEISPILEKKSRDLEILEALKELLRSWTGRSSRYIATVNCPQTAVRRILVPRMPKSELKDALRLHAAQYFPFPIENSYLDFEPLPAKPGADDGKMVVLAAVSPKKTVEDMLALLALAGIQPSALIPAPLAATYASRDQVRQNAKALAILDFGFDLTDLVILSGSDVPTGQAGIVFSRSIPVAGKDFTQAMMVSLASEKGRVQLVWEDAERIKRAVGLPAEGASTMVEEKISTNQILSMLRGPMERLTSEIERCFDYYREETDGGSIGELLLYGGGAQMKGFMEALSSQLGIEARLGAPLGPFLPGDSLPPALQKKEYRLEAAAGAALSATLPPGGINLLPPEIKDQTKIAFKRASFQSAAAATALLFIFVFVGMKIKLSNYETRSAAAQMELSSLKPALQDVRELQLAATIVQNEPYWGEVLKELATVTPRNIHLTRIRMQQDTLFLSGVFVSGNDEPGAQIADYISALENGLFSQVRLLASKEMSNEPGNVFELRMGVE